jgi:hypothetical protein
VNRETALAAVPVDYMSTGAALFEVADRVVVQFVGQSWENPRVVGFLDNPKAPNWTCIWLGGSQYWLKSRDADLMASMFSGGIDVEVKLNGGSWLTLTLDSSDAYGKFYRATFDNGSGAGSGSLWLDLMQSTAGFSTSAVGYGLSPGIAILVSPNLPVLTGGRPLESRNVAEFRIRLAGNTVFNAACVDMGWATEGVTTGYVKTKGGIRIGEDTTPNSTSSPVLKLPYTLTG